MLPRARGPVDLPTAGALQDRVRKYTERGFPRAKAEILVLIEESAVAIFTKFLDHFIIFGGATLVLFYDSPRFLP